ncbi:MAG: acyltransferase family protein [Rhodothermales bacterium]
MLNYRPDIDGLRAVAVLAVLGFHVMPALVSGGFAGVDVFFVISGFLITGILWRDLEAGRLSLASFYARRIRRLYPALVAVILVSAALELSIGLPDEVRTYGWSAISAVFYFSNHFFLAQNDYFDESLTYNPLLHTWSLSVEEQFYLVFPLLLLVLFRAGRRRAPVLLGAIALASLVAAEWLLRTNASAAFFLMPTRLWQLLLGGWLALRPIDIRSRFAREGAGVAGLLLIAGASMVYSEGTPFPGLYALAPTVGAAMLLVAGRQPGTVASRLLSWSPARWIGKISYSLYLWHWPIVVFYRLQVSPEPSATERYGLIAASVLAGYLSWRFIEQPFRNAGAGASRPVFLGGAIATAVVAVVGLTFVLTDGGKERFSDDQLGYISFLDYDADPYFRTNTCFLTSASDDLSLFDEGTCLHYDAAKRNVMIVGDSHAAQYYAAFARRLPNVQFSQVTASGCRPLMNYSGESRCTELVRRAFEQFLEANPYDAVILAGRWEPYDVEALPETVRWLSNRVGRVIVLGPIIEYRQALPRLLARYTPGDSEIEAAQVFADVDATDQAMRAAMDRAPGTYFSILHTLCDGRDCRMLASNGKPLQFDASHLTFQGAYDVVDALIGQGLFQTP